MQGRSVHDIGPAERIIYRRRALAHIEFLSSNIWERYEPLRYGSRS